MAPSWPSCGPPGVAGLPAVVVTLASLIAQENDPSGLSLSQVEQLASQGRDAHNRLRLREADERELDEMRDAHNRLRELAAAYRSLVDAGGCFCRSDKSWLGGWPDDHQEARCRCICDRCAGSVAWAAGLIAAEVPQKQLDSWYHKQLAQVGYLGWVRQALQDGDGYDEEFTRCRRILARIQESKVVLEPWQIELREKVEAEQRELEAERAWLASPEGKAEEARKKAEREAEWEAQRARYEKERAEHRERILARREEMKAEGPYNGPLAVMNNPLESFRRMIAWASSGDPEQFEMYGRLFVARRGHSDYLVEMASNEDCSDEYHRYYRRKASTGEYCDADCGGSFNLKEIKSLAQLDAYLAHRNIGAFYLPDDDSWARWFRQDIPDEDRQQVWADRRWLGVWRLRGVHELPFRRPDGTEVVDPGYDVQSGWWATLPQERIALPQAQPMDLAGQLAEIGWGSSVPYDMTALAAELARRYGVTWKPRALQAKIKQDADELELEGVRVEPTGDKDPRTRRATYRIVVAANPSDPSDPSAALPPGEMPEGS
jgi:hypothetical protein